MVQSSCKNLAPLKKDIGVNKSENSKLHYKRSPLFHFIFYFKIGINGDEILKNTEGQKGLGLNSAADMLTIILVTCLHEALPETMGGSLLRNQCVNGSAQTFSTLDHCTVHSALDMGFLDPFVFQLPSPSEGP